MAQSPVEYPVKNGTKTTSIPVNANPQSEPQTRSTPHNWKLILAYDGTDYCGWQVQPGQPTIQGELQAALRRVTGEAPLPQGSGRTDAGVHALAQVASFDLHAAIPPENLRRALNRTLPPAIRVTEAAIVPLGFHARHSTIAKTYEYRVFLEKPRRGGDLPGRDTLCPPFLARYVFAYPWPMDFVALQQAARAFIGTHDFLSFAATDPDARTRSLDEASQSTPKPQTGPGAPVHSYIKFPHPARPAAPVAPTSPADRESEPAAPTAIRTVFSSAWQQRQIDDGALLLYRVRGNGFLHHMVRNLVGTMLDVGRGYRSVNEVPAMMAARARSAAGPTAPARGLFLHSVEYAPVSES